MLEFRRRGAIVFEYGNGLRLRTRRARRLQGHALDWRASSTMFIRPLFCEGFGPFRWLAVSGDPQDIAEIDGIVERTSPTTTRSATGSPLAREHVTLHRPARAHRLARPRRAQPAGDGGERRRGGGARSRARSPSPATTSTPARSPTRSARARRCRTGRKPSPTGRSSTRCWPAPTAPTSSRCTPWAATPASPPARPRWRTARRRPRSGSRAVLDGDTGIGIMRHAEAGYERALENKRAYGLGFA